jgi:hypothetical protein
MDIQSFILGMCAVLVIALVIGSVVALVKVIKLKKLVELSTSNTLKLIEDAGNETITMINELHTEIDGVHREINEVRREMDSRYDKLKSTFSKEIENAVKHKNN